MNKETIIKVMVFGAISALLLDHIMKPTLRKTIGL